MLEEPEPIERLTEAVELVPFTTPLGVTGTPLRAVTFAKSVPGEEIG